VEPPYVGLHVRLSVRHLHDEPRDERAQWSSTSTRIGAIPSSSVGNGSLIPIEKALKSSIDGSMDELDNAFKRYCVKR